MIQDLKFYADQGSKDMIQGQFYVNQMSTDVTQRISHANKNFKDMIKSRSGQTVKLSVKARETFSQDSPNAEKRLDIKNLILHLTDLLNSWDVDKTSNDLQFN